MGDLKDIAKKIAEKVKDEETRKGKMKQEFKTLGADITDILVGTEYESLTLPLQEFSLKVSGARNLSEIKGYADSYKGAFENETSLELYDAIVSKAYEIKERYGVLDDECGASFKEAFDPKYSGVCDKEYSQLVWSVRHYLWALKGKPGIGK